MRFTALAMLATAICRKPSATCSGVRSSPVRSRISSARAVKRSRTSVVVERLVAVGAEDRGEMGGLDPAEDHVGVGDGQRAAAAVAGRARVRSRRVRPDAVAGAVEVQDRAAARGDGVDVQHRRAQPDAGDLGGEDALVLAREVRDVGGGAAHVEADDAVEAGQLRHPRHADDAAGRPGEDGVLAAELSGFGEAAVGLHEHQPHAAAVRRRRAGRSGAGRATDRRRRQPCHRAGRASSAG